MPIPAKKKAARSKTKKAAKKKVTRARRATRRKRTRAKPEDAKKPDPVPVEGDEYEEAIHLEMVVDELIKEADALEDGDAAVVDVEPVDTATDEEKEALAVEAMDAEIAAHEGGGDLTDDAGTDALEPVLEGGEPSGDMPGTGGEGTPGSEVEMEYSCPTCGAIFHGEMEKCPECGDELDRPDEQVMDVPLSIVDDLRFETGLLQDSVLGHNQALGENEIMERQMTHIEGLQKALDDIQQEMGELKLRKEVGENAEAIDEELARYKEDVEGQVQHIKELQDAIGKMENELQELRDRDDKPGEDASGEIIRYKDVVKLQSEILSSILKSSPQLVLEIVKKLGLDKDELAKLVG